GDADESAPLPAPVAQRGERPAGPPHRSLFRDRPPSARALPGPDPRRVSHAEAGPDPKRDRVSCLSSGRGGRLRRRIPGRPPATGGRLTAQPGSAPNPPPHRRESGRQAVVGRAVTYGSPLPT